MVDLRFDTVDLAAAGVLHRVHRPAVQAGVRADHANALVQLGVGGDEVVDVLVEIGHRHQVALAVVVLEAQVELRGLLRLQRRIADGDGFIARQRVVETGHGVAQEHVVEIRAGDGLRSRHADDAGLAQVERSVQAG